MTHTMTTHYYPAGIKNRRGASTRLLTTRHYGPPIINGPRHRVVVLAAGVVIRTVTS